MPLLEGYHLELVKFTVTVAHMVVSKVPGMYGLYIGQSWTQLNISFL